MGLTSQAESRSTRKTKRKPWQPILPGDPKECVVCGSARPTHVLPGLGETAWRPTIGTLWEVHGLAAAQMTMSCSPGCRRLKGLQSGPFDERLPFG